MNHSSSEAVSEITEITTIDPAWQHDTVSLTVEQAAQGQQLIEQFISAEGDLHKMQSAMGLVSAPLNAAGLQRQADVIKESQKKLEEMKTALFKFFSDLTKQELQAKAARVVSRLRSFPVEHGVLLAINDNLIGLPPPVAAASSAPAAATTI